MESQIWVEVQVLSLISQASALSSQTGNLLTVSYSVCDVQMS